MDELKKGSATKTSAIHFVLGWRSKEFPEYQCDSEWIVTTQVGCCIQVNSLPTKPTKRQLRRIQKEVRKHSHGLSTS